jgi:hypothetical protein
VRRTKPNLNFEPEYDLNFNTKAIERRQEKNKFEQLASKLGENALHRNDKINLIGKLEALLEEELLKMNVVQGKITRSPSEETHRVYLYREETYKWKLAAMRCFSGFKINAENKGMLEVREGDIVKLMLVHPDD